MKAIQVKYLPCTEHRPSRLKAWMEGFPAITESIDYGMSTEQQATDMAKLLMHKISTAGGIAQNENGYLLNNYEPMLGHLPNGDIVFVLVNRKEMVYG